MDGIQHRVFGLIKPCVTNQFCNKIGFVDGFCDSGECKERGNTWLVYFVLCLLSSVLCPISKQDKFLEEENKCHIGLLWGGIWNSQYITKEVLGRVEKT